IRFVILYKQWEETMGEVATNFGFSEAPLLDEEAEELTYIAAISQALHEEMARDPNVLVIGEDVADPFGGAFKVTKGLSDAFGELRVINTPIAENGFIGMATGMALMGLRPVVEVQFADFITSGFDSIVQYAAT